MNSLLSIFKVSFKKTASNFPMIIAGTLIIIVAAMLLVYGLYRATGSEDMSEISVDVGLVNEDTSSKSDFVFNYLQNGSSIKDLIVFVGYDDLEDAETALRRNDVAAFTHVPEGYFDAVVHGHGDPLRLVFDKDRDNPGIGYFLDIIDSTANDVAISQAAIYAAEDIADKYDLPDDAQKKINNDMNDIYMNTFMFREKMYDTNFAGSAKGLTLQDFYFSTLALLIMMLSGVSFISVLKPDSHEIISTMKRRGFPLAAAPGANMSTSLLFSITIILIYLLISHSFINPLGIFLICYCIISFNTLIYRILREDTVAMLTICALSFLLLFLSGAIVPISFMPDAVISIGRMTHVGNSFEMLKGLTVSANRISRYLATAVYGIVFTALAVISDMKEVNRE